MNRNNCFMWAYIAFIFTSSIFKLFIDYSLWLPIVLAITFSSILFAVESGCSSIANALGESINIKNGFLDEMAKQKSSRDKFFNKFEHFARRYQNSEYDFTGIGNMLNPVKDAFKNIDELIDDLKKLNEKNKSRKKHWNIAASIFSFMGFFVMFLTLIFAMVFSIPQMAQEIITVVSFGMILITQQINRIETERIRRESELSKNALDNYIDKFGGLNNLDQVFDLLLENLRELYPDVEGDFNAD